jgi:ketosteroid isomerase-like protein
MPGDEEQLLLANMAFYAALAGGDLAAMHAVWARRVPVACVHPGWQPIRGREAVMASWEAIFEGGRAPAVRCEGEQAHLLGSTAFVTCFERIGAELLAATNLFVLEDGAWRLVHHHAGPVAPRPQAPPQARTLN